MSKADLSPEQMATLRRALTISPRKVGDHPGEAPSPIRLYSENAASFGVPRQFFLKRRRLAHEVEFKVTDGDKTSWPGPLTFSGTLRPEQTLAKTRVVESFKAGLLGGLLRASPGWGKTVWACAVFADLQVPVLVTVHKEFLLNQWKERIEQFLPNAQVGIVQGSTIDWRGRHIAIGMIQSLSDKDYGEDFRNWPGLVITDEVHRIGAETWSRVPPMFPARWRLGLSATPRRKDGADNVFYYHIGDVIYGAKEQRLKPKVRRVWVQENDFKLIHTRNLNPDYIKKTLLLRFMCASRRRNQIIVGQLILAAKKGRKCLVLSERLQHLRDLETALYTMWDSADGPKPSVGFYIGGQKQEALNQAAKARVIFATSQLVQEGLDIPSLDTLFLATPLSDVEQAVGRILRPSDGKKDPIVVDFREDHIKLCRRYAEFRDRYYAKVAAA